MGLNINSFSFVVSLVDLFDRLPRSQQFLRRNLSSGDRAAYTAQ